MMKSKTARFGAFLATLGMSAGLVGTAVHSTGAYFSDTKAGSIAGTIGSIKVTTSGGTGVNNADFSFANLLPGEPQTATVNFQNTGRNTEDVYMVFPNADALHALNDLGHYGEVHINGNGTPAFDSVNLNDHQTGPNPSCPLFDGNGVRTDCNPLPLYVKVADSLAPNSGGFAKFSFNYASKLAANPVDAVPWNCYPLAVPPATQTCTTNGLPYQIVAVQHGQLPGA